MIQLTSEITVRLISSMGGDHMVVAAAKVSTSGEEALQFASKETENFGLINYLMKFRHGTPFEHSCLTFFVHAPIFVFREWHRHRIAFSYNEASARYSKLEPIFWIPRRNREMLPVEEWKPGRPKFLEIPDNFDGDQKYDREIARDREVYEKAYSSYLESISDGIAMEVARCKLPVGIYSSCWVTCNPRSLMAFLSLRTHDPLAKFVSYPQSEIEEAALLCEDSLKIGWPLTHKAFVENGRVGP